jgi:hypothetical protein
MSTIVTPEFDYDEFEETLAELRDHLRASDVVSLVEHDQDAALELIAGLFAVARHLSEAMGRLALMLRRIPTSAERIADQLDELAAALDELVLDVDATSEEEAS